MLSEAQVEQFRTEGYTLAPGFFDASETAALQAEVARWLLESLPRNVATAGDGATPSNSSHNLQLIPLDLASPLFRALPFHPRVMASVSALIGDPVTKILDQAFLKPPGTGAPTNWHTDNAYFRMADPLLGTALWIAIQDATVANGTLKVLPGRHLEKHPHKRDPDSNHHIRMVADDRDAVHCELAAGGVVFFCFGTPHATGPNHTNTLRAGAGIHFINEALGNPALVTGERGRGVVRVTGPGASSGMTEYGLDLGDAWRHEVAALS